MGVHQIHSEMDTVIIPTLQIRKLRWEWRSYSLRISWLVSGKARIEIQADCACKTPWNILLPHLANLKPHILLQRPPKEDPIPRWARDDSGGPWTRL